MRLAGSGNWFLFRLNVGGDYSLSPWLFCQFTLFNNPTFVLLRVYPPFPPFPPFPELVILAKTPFRPGPQCQTLLSFKERQPPQEFPPLRSFFSLIRWLNAILAIRPARHPLDPSCSTRLPFLRFPATEPVRQSQAENPLMSEG